jgi:hypothetical protein
LDIEHASLPYPLNVPTPKIGQSHRVGPASSLLPAVAAAVIHLTASPAKRSTPFCQVRDADRLKAGVIRRMLDQSPRD